MKSNEISIAFDGREDSNRKVTVFEAKGFPAAAHPAEADLFARHEGIPGHNQAALEEASVLMVGAGGLGSWAGLALVRSGVRRLTIVDPDSFDRTNAPRQLMYADDLRRTKAMALARNLVPQMIAGGTVTALPCAFEDLLKSDLALSADALLVLVDNNQARLAGVRFARQRRIPAVFTMLSPDGMRLNSFLQDPGSSDPCLWCALPNLDPEGLAPCASGVITTCLAAAARTVFFAHRAIMGWADPESAFNWCEDDLAGVSPCRTGRIRRRSGCAVCADS